MKFIVLIDEAYVQDAHIYTGEKFPDTEEDCWDDFKPSAFLGIYTAESKEEAVNFAHETHSWIPKECMYARQV